MGDLPEHAAQVALLHDLAIGSSPWSDLVRVNLCTPYLLGYGLALLLSFAVPVLVALKLVLSLAYYAFVAACIHLRKKLGGDPRLDWLFVASYFGFSFQYGFYTYLVATPVAVLFLGVSASHANRPTSRSAFAVGAAGLLLFFSHALVFVFGWTAGLGFVLTSSRRRASSLVPFALLALFCALFFFTVTARDAVLAFHDGRVAFSWGWKGAALHRVINYPILALGSGGKDKVADVVAVLLLAGPWALGLRPSRDLRAWVPLATVVVIWLFVPVTALKTDYLSQRFALFLFPAYALVFDGRHLGSRDRSARVRGAHVALACTCAAFLAIVGLRQHRFAIESAPFEEVLAAAQPGQRALGLIYAPQSECVHNPYTFHVFPVWYEVDKGGFVDFNFAYFLPQIVRFRPGRAPLLPSEFDGSPDRFDWHAFEAQSYRYFFVKHAAPLPPRLFENDSCQVSLVRASPGWSLFERTSCR